MNLRCHPVRKQGAVHEPVRIYLYGASSAMPRDGIGGRESGTDGTRGEVLGNISGVILMPRPSCCLAVCREPFDPARPEIGRR
jgi:hypothetical protein